IKDNGGTATVTGTGGPGTTAGLSKTGVDVSTTIYTANITVLQVSDAPVATTAPKTTILEDNTYVFQTTDFAANSGSPNFTLTSTILGSTSTSSTGQDTSTASVFSVNVTPVNDAPVTADNTGKTISEDTIYPFNTGDFAFSDPSDAKPPSSVNPQTSANASVV